MSSVRIDPAGCRDLCKSDAVKSMLLQAAQSHAAVCQGRIPGTTKKYANPDVAYGVDEADNTAIGYVVAANPRSNWYAHNRGVLSF